MASAKQKKPGRVAAPSRRKAARKNNALVPGQCAICKCVWDRPCDRGCSWTDRSETNCTQCAIFRKMTREQVIALLVATGFLKLAGRGKRALQDDLEDAIASFTDVVEALAANGYRVRAEKHIPPLVIGGGDNVVALVKGNG